MDISGYPVRTITKEGSGMTQITLADSGSGVYDFAGAPPSSMSFATNGMSGAALFPPADLGGYSFGAMPWTTSAPLVGGNFAVSVDQSFSYSSPDGDALTATVHWNLLKDHSSNPDLIGTMSILSVSGDGDFTSAFVVGGTAHIDLALAFKNPTSPLLDDLAVSGGNTWATISAGEIVALPAVPEPGTLGVLGIALLVVAGAMRRGSRRDQHYEAASAI